MRRRTKVLGGTVCLAALAAIAIVALPASGTAPTGSSFFAVLDGEHENPDADLDGYGTFSASFRGNVLCYGIQVANIGTPTAAHIHAGGVNVNGPIRVGLTAPTTGLQGASAKCQSVPAAQASAIKQSVANNPTAGFYVNVHTDQFPNGAIRGQLFKATLAQNK
jgi:hypothetical protein